MKLQKSSIEAILQNNRRIICFGAGKGFDTFCRTYEELNISDYIEGVIDNNTALENTHIEVYGKQIPILGIDSYIYQKKYNVHNLIITSTFLKEILMQLNQYSQLQEHNCFYYQAILAQSESYLKNYLPESLHLSETARIPKIIHYCWFGKGEMSELNKKCIRSWQKYCPDYQIVQWNEDNYNLNKSKFMAEAYNRGKWAFVADPARVDIMYEHGGIYLDTDVEIVKNLDDLLYQEAFAGVDRSLRISLGLGFGSIPHKKEFLDMYHVCDQADIDWDSQQIESPNFMKPYFENLGYCGNGKYQILKGITIYPERVLSGYNPITREYSISDQTYLTHLYEGTWVGAEREAKNKRSMENYQIMKEHGIV